LAGGSQRAGRLLSGAYQAAARGGQPESACAPQPIDGLRHAHQQNAQSARRRRSSAASRWHQAAMRAPA